MDSRGIAAAMMLGASGVQMGTAFVSCPETGVNAAYVGRDRDPIQVKRHEGEHKAPHQRNRSRPVRKARVSRDLSLSLSVSVVRSRGLGLMSPGRIDGRAITD